MIKLYKLYFLLFILFLWSCKNEEEKFNIYVYFKNVESLTNNSKVYCKGLEIGEVKNMTILNNNVLVELKIDSNIKINKGSKIYIKNIGLLGSGSVEILLDSLSHDYIRNYDTIFGNEQKKGDAEKFIELINKK